MYNIDIRDAIKKAGFKNYEIASTIGMSETSFSRLISRSELVEEVKTRIYNGIEYKQNERAGENAEKHI